MMLLRTNRTEVVKMKWYSFIWLSLCSHRGLETLFEVIINLKPVNIYVGYLESKERLRIQPAQLFNFS